MTITSSQKVLAALLGFAMVLTLVAGLMVVPANAQTVTFTRNLTVGSRGAEVVALQTWLETQNYLTMPAGVAKGYFGNLTRAAVAKYQKAVGITPAVGYFGPITRAKLNGGVVGTPGAACPAGYVCTPTGQTPGQITTPGVEGTLTVTQNGDPASGTTVREGETMKSTLGIKVEAKNSDIALQRVKVQLGTTTTYYTKVFKKIYITDASGNTLGSAELNSDTVSKDGSNYFVTVAGLNKIVKKGMTEVLYVKFDLHSSIKTADLWARTITVPANGVRGVDGAGIDQYAPAAALSGNAITIAGTLVDSASLTLSLDPSTRLATEVIADEDKDGEGSSNADDKDAVELSKIKLEAKDDAVTVTDMTVSLYKSGSGSATVTTAWVYDGDTLVGSGSVSGQFATISDIDYKIPANTTKTLTIKANIRNANGTVTSFTAGASSTSIIAENSQGTSITPSGSTTGNLISTRNVGVEVALVGAPTITKSTETSNGLSTSTLEATFTLSLKAVNGDIMFGTTGSTSGAMVNGDVTHFQLYRNGAAAAQAGVSTSTSLTVPSTGVVTTGLTNSFLLQKGNSVTVPVKFSILSRATAGTQVSTFGQYAVQLQAVSWVGPSGVASTTFMNGLSSWRTAEVAFP